MTLLHRPRAAIRSLLESESGGGIILICAAAAALFVANSPAAPLYFQALETTLGPLSLLHWINDALMALFFLLIGLEIKREFIGGELSSWQARSLPGLAAIGGMIVPALIYIGFNSSAPQHLRGWAVPTATDIAFALGVLALLGSRVPQSLKVFLTALAIIDDLGAVAIIALAYSNGLSILWLGLSAALGLVLGAMNRAGIQRLIPYLLVGGLLWFCVHRSGVHATLAGVVLAMAIPVRDDQTASPLHRLEHALQPWIGYLVVPLFGFANAGVALSATSSLSAANGVPVGTAAGLFLGKQLGVFSFAWASIRMGLSTRPDGASTTQLYGVSTLCGIGFTMSLFIGLLAFPQSPALQDAVKVGVLAGSLASALLGTIVLITAQKRSRKIAADKLHS